MPPTRCTGTGRPPAGPVVPTSSPPPHVVVAGHQRDQQGFLALLGLDRSRVVVGSVGWEYERALCVGDRLVGVRTVVADETREGRAGAMRLVTLETEFADQDGTVAVRQREVLIERAKS